MLLNIDPATRIIEASVVPIDGSVVLDVQRDFYSECKRLWFSNATLNRLRFPFFSIGGNSLTPTRKLGGYFFLRNDLGWRLKPFENDHQLILDENLFGNDTSLPVIRPTDGSFTVDIVRTVSPLTVESISFEQQDRTRLARVEKIIANKMVTDPTSGTLTVYENDSITPSETAEVFEDAAGTQRYRGQGIERREKLR